MLEHARTYPHLPTHEYVLRLGDVRIGKGQLRMKLSHSRAVPTECASHVYYEISPPYRRMGFGAALFALLRREAAGLRMGRLVVVCAARNLASRRVIERNGGVLTGVFSNYLRFETDAADFSQQRL
jgi:predicted acetyltransferase